MAYIQAPWEIMRLRNEFEALRAGVEALGLGTIAINLAHDCTDVREDEDGYADWLQIVCFDAKGIEIIVLHFITRFYIDDDPDDRASAAYASKEYNTPRWQKLWDVSRSLKWNEAFKRAKRAYRWLAKDRFPGFTEFPEPQYLVLTYESLGIEGKEVEHCEGPYSKELAELRKKGLQNEYQRFNSLTASVEGCDPPTIRYMVEVVPLARPLRLTLPSAQKAA